MIINSMKIIFKNFVCLLLIFFTLNFNLAFSKDKYVGKGQLIIDGPDLDYFFNNYLKTPAGQTPLVFWIAEEDGKSIWSAYWYCPGGGDCMINNNRLKKICEIEGNKYYRNQGIDKDIECFIFAKKRQLVWDTGSLPDDYKLRTFKLSWSIDELKDKLKQYGFNNDQNVSLSNNSSNKKQVSNQNKTKEERSIAVSWEGYQDLIAGTVKFNETDHKGNLNLSLPNNDGLCDGSYSLYPDGKGTWQITCTNNMGAAGTLKWSEGSGITGSGLDYKDKKVKFTVSKK